MLDRVARGRLWAGREVTSRSPSYKSIQITAPPLDARIVGPGLVVWSSAATGRIRVMAHHGIPVALGSWFFSLAVDAPTTIAPTDFYDQVRRCLLEIDGVEHVEVDLAAMSRDEAPQDVLPLEDPRYGEYVGPHWNFESVSFSLRLPLDVQAALLDLPSSLPRHAPVDFRVILAYGWAVPISSVTVVESGREVPTSPAAAAVYRYLVQQTSRSTGRVRLSCIPPIFAHAEFYLHVDDGPPTGAARFWRLAHTVPDYRRYDIGFDASAGNDPVPDFLRAVGSELDLYYQIVHSEGDRRHSWERITSLVSELTELRRQRGFRGTLKRLLRADRRTTEAIILLTEFAADDQMAGVDFRRQLRNLYTAGATTLVQELVESELADRSEYPIQQFSRLVELYQQRRLTDREMIVVVVTSLLGGAVGTAATLLAGG